METKKIIKTVKNTLIYYCILSVITMLRAMSRRQTIVFMKLMGALAYYLAWNERKKTLRHLTWAFGGELSPRDIRRLGRRVFRNLAVCIGDALRLPRLVTEGLDSIVIPENLHHLHAAMAKSSGVIVQTGHYGNWELLGTWLASKNIPLKVVAKKLYDPRLDKLLVDYRNQAGYANTARGKATSVIVQGLKNGCVFGMLFDVDTKIKGEFVDFFGKPAHTAVIPAILAMQLKVPIVPVFIRLRDDFTYVITALEPIQIEVTGNETMDVIRNTQKCSHVYEQMIRKYPDQWIWMHERWKKQPRVAAAPQ
ncbi:MAG: hypothetical protein V1793_18070 [Pseudomonadota bacterium]